MTKYFYLAMSACLIFASCGDDDLPPAENEEEVIDLVMLTFSPVGGGTDLVFTATDPDGEGPQDLAPDQSITLAENTTYTLAIKLENTEEEEDITKEVQEEGDEHLFFFSFTTDAFSDPAGNGNIDSRADDVNYLDMDDDGLPIGLSTQWETGSALASGSFRVVLKHQPDIKTTTSTASDGESDVDITWTLEITGLN